MPVKPLIDVPTGWFSWGGKRFDFRLQTDDSDDARLERCSGAVVEKRVIG